MRTYLNQWFCMDTFWVYRCIKKGILIYLLQNLIFFYYYFNIVVHYTESIIFFFSSPKALWIAHDGNRKKVVWYLIILCFLLTFSETLHRVKLSASPARTQYDNLWQCQTTINRLGIKYDCDLLFNLYSCINIVFNYFYIFFKHWWINQRSSGLIRPVQGIVWSKM